MKKYRKHYYVKGMNTKYLTPLVCSPRMVRAPHSAVPQELDLPGTMKEWRKDRDTENLGSVGLDSLMKTPQSPRLNMFIIYDWAGKQSYCIQLNEETGLSNLCMNSQEGHSFQREETMVGIVCIHCRQTWSRLCQPYEPHLEKALNSHGLFKILASWAWPCPCQHRRHSGLPLILSANLCRWKSQK